MPNAKMKQSPPAAAHPSEGKVLNLIHPSKIKKEPVSPQKPTVSFPSPSKPSSALSPTKLTNGISFHLSSKSTNLPPSSSKNSQGTLSNGSLPSSQPTDSFGTQDFHEDVKPKLSRLASLNAIAKVHVLMERTSRPKASRAPLNNANVEVVDVKPNVELLRSQMNEAKTQSEGKTKSPHLPKKVIPKNNNLKIKNNLRSPVTKNVNLVKKMDKKTPPSATSSPPKKLTQRVTNKLSKLPKLIQIKKEKDPIPSTSGTTKSKPSPAKVSATKTTEAKEKKKKLTSLPVKKVKPAAGLLETATKRMASINAKAILALNSHKDTASKTKKKILKQITSRAKLKQKKAAATLATTKATPVKKRKLSTQSTSAPPAKKQNKEVPASSPVAKSKKRPYRRKSVQTAAQTTTAVATKSSPPYCYPHFQSPVHYSTSPIIFHGYDYNTSPSTIMDNYPPAPPPPALGMVEQVGLSTFGSCCRGCPGSDPLLHPIHVLSSHSCHHCSPCSACHHCPAATAFHPKVESEQWQSSLTSQELNQMVKKYQKNLLPNLNKKVASNKPEEVKGKKDLRVRAKAQEDEAQVSSSTDVQQAADSLPPQVKKAATSASSKFHGWSWLGEPYEKLVYKSNDETATLKLCYPAIHHIEGDTIRERDSVLLRSAKGRVEQPYVAKITAFWENEEGDMMMSLLWYYRPEHSDRSRHMEDEIFASKHKDINGVGCIDDKCYVLTFFEYCRYRKESKRIQEGSLPYPNLVPGPDDGYPRSCRLPVPGVVSPESVMFCRQVYDFRQKRLLKNPS